MKKVIIVVAAVVLLFNGYGQNTAVQPSSPNAFSQGESLKNAAITYRVFPVAGQTYGYDILVNKKLMIHQSTPPGLSGNNGFKSRDAAVKVAELVVRKMMSGQMPPGITQQEMKNLNAL